MKRLLFLLILAGATQALAQTKTTEKLDADYDGMSLYFYKNTLRMLNQKGDPAFDDMIKDIEKIRFVLISRNEGKKFTNSDYAKLKSDYLKKESFEEIMNGRLDGRNLNVLVRESGGKVKGTVIMAGDSSNLYVLDILGKIAIEKAGSLFKMIDENSDVAEKLKRHID
jgi:hypothetical protein